MSAVPALLRPEGPASSYARRVLLAVTGLTPQVITETVYALACTGAPSQRFVPTEVQVLTTQVGAAKVRSALLQEGDGAFQALMQEHGLPAMRFGADQVVVIRDAADNELDDIRDAADNACMANAITERVRQLTADPQCALHVSIAGGRKTMGFYAGYALSLFGRPQDSLSHVLVSPPFEAAAAFYYPTVQPHTVYGRGGEPLDASQAAVELALIPFVRLREGLPAALLAGQATFDEVVQAAAAVYGPPRLEVDVQHRQVVADGRRLRLTPQSFSLFAALAGRALLGLPALPAPPREVPSDEWAEELLGGLRQALGQMHVDSRFEDSMRRDCSGAKVSPAMSRLKRALHEQLAPGRARLYLDDGGRHKGKRYSVPLEPKAITIRHGPAPAASLPRAQRR